MITSDTAALTVAFGADVEFVCIDTSLSRDLPTPHFFEHPRHRRFLADALPGAPGPHHLNTPAVVDHLVPLFRRAGVGVAFAGHEHNFQLSRVDGVDYVLSGAGGQLREQPPEGFAAAGTVAWAAQAHLLLASVVGAEMTVTPVAGVDRDGELQPVTPRAPDGRLVEVPFTVRVD